MEITPYQLGQAIKFYRRQAQLTQVMLSRQVKKAKGTIKSIEQGARSPSTKLLNTIATVLDVSVSRIYSKAEEFPRGKNESTEPESDGKIN